MSYRFADSLRAGSGRNCSSVLILLASCMTYTIAVCTVKNCWWWTEGLSETCRVSFRKRSWEISASIWLYYKNNFKLLFIESRKWTVVLHLMEIQVRAVFQLASKLLFRIQIVVYIIWTPCSQKEKLPVKLTGLVTYGMGNVSWNTLWTGR